MIFSQWELKKNIVLKECSLVLVVYTTTNNTSVSYLESTYIISIYYISNIFNKKVTYGLSFVNERRDIMANKIRTSKSVAKKASSQLRSKKTTKATKSVAGSALSNRRK